MMKKVILVCLLLLLLGSGCNRKTGNYTCTKLYVDGKETYIVDVYIDNDFVCLPFYKVMQALGAKGVESSLDRYGRECFEFREKRYIIDWGAQTLMLERDMILREEEEKQVSAGTNNRHSLMPEMSLEDRPNSRIKWEAREVYMGNNSLVELLAEMGCDILIEWDLQNEIVYISLENCA